MYTFRIFSSSWKLSKKNIYVTDLKDTLAYDNIFTVEPIELSGGLDLMWKSSLNVTILSYKKIIIDIKVKSSALNFFVSCVHGDPVRA